MVDEMGNDDFQIKTSKTNLGLQVKTSIRDINFKIDEPKFNGGDDTGITPVELELTALGLIATEGSIYDHLYEDELHKLGKKVEFGGPEIQPMVNDLIYRNIKEQEKIDSKLYHNIKKRCMIIMVVM